MPRPQRSPNAAVRAEPRGIGTARARDPLAREVKLLGALLGQVIVEQEGVELLELVERIRRAPSAPQTGTAEDRRTLAAALDTSILSAPRSHPAFALYSTGQPRRGEERVRRLRRRARRSPHAIVDGSVADALDRLRRAGVPPVRRRSVVDGLSVSLVLTAHPTEARRRTMLMALRRCYHLLDRLDDPRLTPGEDAEARRRLREEITVLWHTSPLRVQAVTAVDEVRSVMAFFDESLFVVTPRLYRAVDAALDEAPDITGPARDSGRTGARPPVVRPFLEWGSWVGGDRDGNPNVTAATTREAVRIQADHALRGYEAVVRRLSQTVAATRPALGVPSRLREQLDRDELELPETAADTARRFPAEPWRQALVHIEERLRRTRRRVVDGIAEEGGFGRVDDLLAAIDVLRDALVSEGMARVANGELWTCVAGGTFGFHALGLEIRQHSEVHGRALAALRDGSTEGVDAAPGVPVEEVLETFRAVAAIQAELGERACHRYVISFTRGARDVLDVLRLADAAGAIVNLDVVPCSSRRTRSRHPAPSWTSCSRTPGTGSTSYPGTGARR